MNFRWEDKTIDWMLRAAEYTGFYRNMAALLLPYIQRRNTLCDLGCGMALTDMALAGEIQELTCIDISQEVLAFAVEESGRRGLRNLSFLQSDAVKAPGSWETVLVMFHGRIDKIGSAYLSKATDRLLFVTHGPGIQHSGAFCADATETEAWLKQAGWHYTRQDAVLEFGQPHRSVADALESTAAFHPSLSQEELQHQVFSKLQETGRTDYPYFTPKSRSFAIFDIPKSENERTCQGCTFS